MESLLNEKYMRRCLELAAKGLGQTRSNPMVGAVIVHKGLIIGEGYHHKFGGPHAEVNAINSVVDKNNLKKSTLFVNLEPCSHYGKTPPCSLLIRDAGIPRVIVGSTDPNPLVSGRGIDLLRKEGVELITGISEKECKFLNRRFYTFQEQKRPYIILKWAETKDGYIDNRVPGDYINPPLRITGDLSRILVHKWRSEEMAIMAGTNTINMDNPSLTVRYWFGENPTRISIERNTQIREDATILNDGFETIIYSFRKNELNNNVKYIGLNHDSLFPETVLSDLWKRNIVSVIIEGGAKLLECFIKKDLWDEARIFKGNKTAGRGTLAPVLNASGEKVNTGDDELFICFRKIT